MLAENHQGVLLIKKEPLSFLPAHLCFQHLKTIEETKSSDQRFVVYINLIH